MVFDNCLTLSLKWMFYVTLNNTLQSEYVVRVKSMFTYRFITALALGCYLIAYPTPAAVSAETIVRVGGSGTATGTMQIIAQNFEKNHPGIKIKVMPSLGSSGGIKALLGGALDIALSARPLKAEETKQGITPVFTGRTPFIMLAHTGVRQTGISAKELEAILDGRQQVWPDGSRLRLVLRPEGDADTQIIQAISPKIHRAMKAALARPGMHIALTDQDAARDIAKTPGALGFSSIAQFTSEKLQARPLAYNGIKPSLKTLTGRSYPLAKELTMVLHPGRITPAAQLFISFITSSQGVKLLEKQGVITDIPAKGH